MTVEAGKRYRLRASGLVFQVLTVDWFGFAEIRFRDDRTTHRIATQEIHNSAEAVEEKPAEVKAA